MIRALRWIVLVASVGLLVWSAGPQLQAIDRRPSSTAVDLLPVWCRARALVYGDGACGPELMSAIFRKPIGPARDQSSPYYYPPTAALLLAPTAPLPFDEVARGFRWASIGALVLAAALVVGAAPVRDPVLAGAAVALVSAGLFGLRLVRGSLLAGQTGPLVVGFTAVALWAVGRRRERLGGSLVAVGVALKLFPALVLPAVVRRPPFLGWFLGVLLALVAATAVFPNPDASFAWLAGAAEFVDRPMRDAWIHNEPPWVLSLWSARFLGLGIPTALVTLVTARRPRPASVEVAAAFLLVAWGGTVMAGSPQTHEGLVVLPAVLWVLVWPLQRGPTAVSVGAALAIAAAAWRLGIYSPFSPPNSLHWVPMGYLAWAGSLLRWGVALRAEAQPQRSSGSGQ